MSNTDENATEKRMLEEINDIVNDWYYSTLYERNAKEFQMYKDLLFLDAAYED